MSDRLYLVFAPAAGCGRLHRLVGTAADLEGAWDLAAGYLAGRGGLSRGEVVIYETAHPGPTTWTPCPPAPIGWRARAVPVRKPAVDNSSVPEGLWW